MDFVEYLETIEDGSVDFVLTDPPYDISKKYKESNTGMKRFQVTRDFGQWDTDIDLITLCDELYRVLRNGGSAIIWYDLWKLSFLAHALEDAGFGMKRWVIWEKTNPVPLNMSSTYLGNSREVAISCVKKNKPTFHSSYNNGVYHGAIPQNRVHPTQKPLQLFSDIIEVHTNKNDIVLDPFLGSGTTAVAALQLHRRFMGCDKEQKYIDKALQRVNNIQTQLK